MIRSKIFSLLGIMLTVCYIGVMPVCAQEPAIHPSTQFCFSTDDFTSAETDEGVFLTSVPKSNIAKVCYGSRVLRAGDALPREALDMLTLEANCVTTQTAAVTYCTIGEGTVSETKELKFSVLAKKNEPPTALDSTIETYRNIPNNGTLSASDPEKGILTYDLLQEPKRGTVELHEDGTFTYIPNENKVGTDSFTFSVTDEAGNTSSPAKVTVKIKKPLDKSIYADMQGQQGEFAAMWLKDQKLFAGNTVGDHLCFSPQSTVSRGEFLVMVMTLVDADTNDNIMSTGFADETETPTWMQPYITAALSNGMIAGSAEEDGVRFRPADTLTKAEAAVLLQNILDLPMDNAKPVFSQDHEETVPVWAVSSAAALSNAGISLQIKDSSDPLTRLDAAQLLYEVNQLLETRTAQTFFWVQ